MILNDNIVLSLQSITKNNPLICYKNLVTEANVSTTSQTAQGPATNLANTSTAFGWEATSTATQTITVTLDNPSEVDYIGFARHNLFNNGALVRIRFDNSVVLDWQQADKNQANLFLFQQALPAQVHIDITGSAVPAKIGVLYVGKSTQLQRKIYVGHTPITYGRNINSIMGVSQSGQYLGEIELNRTLTTSVSMNNLTPDYYRSTLDPFFAQTPRKPCFWAWRPEDYETEVGFCWVEGDPRPTNERNNGMMSISWNFRGIA